MLPNPRTKWKRISTNFTMFLNFQSLKGDTAGDQTTNLAAKSSHPSKGNNVHITAKETFKAGFKAAKDQYHQAKAQFKATTKALLHAKFNKGSKASKGDKGNCLIRSVLMCKRNFCFA